MKTIPLEEALADSPAAPFIVFKKPELMIRSAVGWTVATFPNAWKREALDAALLAHFYNHGPELVQAVADLIQSNEALHAALRIDPSINLTLSDAKRLLAKASTVQMP